MLYKLIDNELVPFKERYIIKDKKVYANPTEEILLSVGYKPLIYDEVPEYDIEAQYLEKSYTEDEEYITEHYTVCDYPVFESEEATENFVTDSESDIE